MGEYNITIGQGCYKIRREEAFCILDKEPSISIKKLAAKMGVSYGYAGNWLVAYRRHRRIEE